MSQRFQDRQERDLFNQISPGDKPIKKKAKIFFPDQKKDIAVSYENLIFILIVFIMSSIIFFSLGVEKGILNEEDSVFGMPKFKIVRTKIKKEKAAEKPEEAKPCAEPAAATAGAVKTAAVKKEEAPKSQKEKKQ